MFRLSRPIWRHQPLIQNQIRLYRLTSNEIAAGLKPLIVKIHPDLYANYPDIQEVNSRSLSNLQSWLDQVNDRMPNLPSWPCRST